MLATPNSLLRFAVGGLALIALAAVVRAVVAGASPTRSQRPPASVADASDRDNPSKRARLLFATRLEDGLDEFTEQINGERVVVVNDPSGKSARKVLRFTVRNSDTGPTDNPRAQLETPFDFEEGDDRYAGFSYYFASDFPSELPSRAWVTLGSIAYGPPFDGAGPLSIRVQNGVSGRGAELRWQRNDTYRNDIPWTGPKISSIAGRWVRFVIRAKLHRNPRVGFVELWMNTGSGWRRQRLAGRNRLYMTTYDASNNGGPNNSRLGLYYRKDIPGPLTVHHGGLRIATAGKGAFQEVAGSER